MPMTISYVEENKPFLSCPCTQSSHDSTFAEVYREGRTDWVSIKLQWRQAFFKKSLFGFMPLGYVIITTANPQTWLLAYSYIELFVHIKLFGCP